MNKYFLIIALLLCISLPIGAAESPYSTSLSRMEREWFHKEFPQDNDDIRLDRLEEKVFGTIHDVEKNIRYDQLRKAFDAKKNRYAQRRPNYLYGTPTSIPMNVDELLGY